MPIGTPIATIGDESEVGQRRGSSPPQRRPEAPNRLRLPQQPPRRLRRQQRSGRRDAGGCAGGGADGRHPASSGTAPRTRRAAARVPARQAAGGRARDRSQPDRRHRTRRPHRQGRSRRRSDRRQTGPASAAAARRCGPTCAAPRAPPAAQAAAGAAPNWPAGRRGREMSRIRKTTGKRMAEAKQTIPHFYVTSEVDMARGASPSASRSTPRSSDDATKISFNDLIVKAAALALREFPNLNTSLEGDTLYDHAKIDINIAVAIEGGLIAPFIPDADQKSPRHDRADDQGSGGRARNGGLLPEEYQGGTFTISNLGMFDVDEFIAIINPPQAAILAIGSISRDARWSRTARWSRPADEDHAVGRPPHHRRRRSGPLPDRGQGLPAKPDAAGGFVSF